MLYKSTPFSRCSDVCPASVYRQSPVVEAWHSSSAYTPAVLVQGVTRNCQKMYKQTLKEFWQRDKKGRIVDESVNYFHITLYIFTAGTHESDSFNFESA